MNRIKRRNKPVTDKGYRSYVKMYKEKEQTMQKYDHEMNLKMLTRTQWEETYKAQRNTLRKQVAAGERKAVGNVNQVLVSKEAYPYTYKQARALKKAAKTINAEHKGEKGYKPITEKSSALRRGEFDWGEIDRYYHQLKNAGLDTFKASDMIGAYFFGSE